MRHGEEILWTAGALGWKRPTFDGHDSAGEGAGGPNLRKRKGADLGEIRAFRF